MKHVALRFRFHVRKRTPLWEKISNNYRWQHVRKTVSMRYQRASHFIYII